MKKVYLLFICLVFISSCNDDLVMERNDILSPVGGIKPVHT